VASQREKLLQVCNEGRAWSGYVVGSRLPPSSGAFNIEMIAQNLQKQFLLQNKSSTNFSEEK